MRYRKKPIDYLGQMIAISSVFFCAKYIEWVNAGFEVITYLALAMGFACLVSPILSYQIPCVEEKIKPSWLKAFSKVIVSQLILIFLSVFVLGTFLWQTQLNHKFQSIHPERLLANIEAVPVYLWVSPWLLYTFLAVGFGYYVLIKKRAPWIPGILMPKPSSHSGLFAENYLFAINNIAHFLVITTVYTLGIIVLCESICHWVGFPSLFKAVFQAPILGLVVFFLVAKLREMNIHWMLDKRWNLGFILLSIALTFSLIFLWLHNMVSIVTVDNISFPVTESALLGEFSETNLDNRLQSLIWGWMLLGTPIMASWYVKQFQGLKVWKLLPSTLALPMLIAICFNQEAMVNALSALSIFIKYPIIQMMCAIVALSIMSFLLYRVHNLADLNRCFLPPTARIREKALIKIAGQLGKMSTICVSGVFMLGWPVFQVMFMAAAIFMLLNLIWLFGLFLKDGAGEYSQRLKKMPAAEQQA